MNACIVFKTLVTCRFQKATDTLSITLHFENAKLVIWCDTEKIMHSFFLLFILLFIHSILHALKLLKYLKRFWGEIFLPHHFT